MKAQIAPGYDKNRVVLKDAIPIQTPYTLFVSPSQLCNFKCHYCAHSLSNTEKREAGLVRINLSDDIFSKILKQSEELGGKFKRILLTGLGEPLLNEKIAEIVKQLKQAGVSEKIEIFTNASKLNDALSDALIDSGLTKLRISIQGTSADTYKKQARVKVDFDALVGNIGYFYERSRGRCQVYIKIIEEELDSPEDKELFFKMFGDICDEIYVENLVRAQPMMGDYGNKVSADRTFYGEESQKRDVCPYIFYSLQIDSEGNCFPCPPLGLPKSFSLGNINDQPISEIWYGEKHQQLMAQHLRKDGSRPKLCQECTCYKAFTPEPDALDAVADEILERLTDG